MGIDRYPFDCYRSWRPVGCGIRGTSLPTLRPKNRTIIGVSFSGTPYFSLKKSVANMRLILELAIAERRWCRGRMKSARLQLGRSAGYRPRPDPS
jgi:hypothetical protein